MWAIALPIATPVLFIVASLFTNASEIWSHLAETVLWGYLRNSFALMFGVGGSILAIGVVTAWLVSACRFPGSRFWEWALVLPLAAPSYLLAYTYTDMLDYFGPVQAGLRSLLGWESAADYWFPSVRSLWGAIAMFALVLYPYVYILARVAFLEQSTCTLEASRTLKCNPWESFFRVALPLARPAIASGVAIALMETLGDFGTVEYFGVSTFTTGIYRTWFGMGERVAATQLAAALLAFVLTLLAIERVSRRRARYYNLSTRHQSPRPYSLGFGRAIAANLACLLPVSLGFAVPAGYLAYLAIAHASETFDRDFWELGKHSFLVAGMAAIATLIFALILAYGRRLQNRVLVRLGVQIAVAGYALPGTVIAVGVAIPLGRLDNAIDRWFEASFGISTGLLLSGTVVALVFAYCVRFLALSTNTVESSLGKIKPSFDDAARSLGYNPAATLARVHVPLMWGGMLSAVMLVFVDAMKELPATLVLRPFNFDTLAVRVYQYASDERLIEASAPALAIVLAGIFPVILLSRRIARSRRF